MSELKLAYSPDDEWTGTLEVTARSGGFSGRGVAYIAKQQVVDRFVARLRAAKLSSAQPAEISDDFSPTKVHVTIVPHDLRGTLRVRIDVGTNLSRKDSEELVNAATDSFLSNYGATDRFCNALEALLDGRLTEAVLSDMPQD